MTRPRAPRWWQRGAIYQAYLPSFQDSNGDGVGDLPGLVRRLDYLQWLGVDAVWLSPIHPSPWRDGGYDVADYLGVDPRVGTLADLDALIAEAHARRLRVLLDWVPNHTSNEHPWFRAARSARTDPQRDWYIWRDRLPDETPPTNWQSSFGGSSWRHDPQTDQAYLHTFLAEQPDLNWRNPQVRKAMFATLRFWLRRGVDGFRIDVLPLLIKDDRFRDNPVDPRNSDSVLPLYTVDRPEMRDLVGEIRSVVDEFDDRVLLAEVGLPPRRLVSYYGAEGGGIHLPFNFSLMDPPWQAEAIGEAVRRFDTLVPAFGWPSWVVGNHDRARVASRLGLAQARVAMLLLLTLRGTPTLYYGDELGLPDAVVSPASARDQVGRDPERSPMAWDGTPNAGFCPANVQPWLPLVSNHETLSVAAQRSDPTSLLALTHMRSASSRQMCAALLSRAQRAAAQSARASRAAHRWPRVMVCSLASTDRSRYFRPAR